MLIQRTLKTVLAGPVEKSSVLRQSFRGLKAIGRELDHWREVRQLSTSLDSVRPLSMVHDFGLIHLSRILRTVLEDQVPGDLVECGVWKGGAAFLLADQLKRAGNHDRKVWMFDSFEGLPPPDEIDGAAALAYSREPGRPDNFDNCRVTLEEVEASAQKLGLTAHTKLVKGWFSDTLPAVASTIGPIAILRIDSDWYSSVRCCLDHLFDQVSEGGFIVLDDYFVWDGCAIAIHEFLSDRRLPLRIEHWGGAPAFLRKLTPPSGSSKGP
jgi:hypothetical protein